MQGYLGFLVLAAALVPRANAQDIHRCVSDENVVAYQNAPCEAGSIDAGILRLPAYADPPQRDTASAPGADPGTPADAGPGERQPNAGTIAHTRAFPFRRTIALGVTDDQVLNLADWGRPSHIARTRSRHGFRERWTYATDDGPRELSFVNGRLVDIDLGAAAPGRLASLSMQR